MITSNTTSNLSYFIENNELSFCKRAYSKHKMQDDEVELALQKHRLILSPGLEQTQSIFLSVCLEELQYYIFKFLDKKDLSTCRLVCKKINNKTSTLYHNLALPTLSIDFKKLEVKINNELGRKKIVTLSPDRNKSIGNILIIGYDNQVLLSSDKKIDSFKAHCIFLANNINEDRRNIKGILKFVIKLQKSCQYYLAKNNETLQIFIQENAKLLSYLNLSPTSHI